MSGWKEDEEGEGGETGTVFEDVDLTEKEWADYDERSADTKNYFTITFYIERSRDSNYVIFIPFCVSGQMSPLLSRKSESALSL